MLFWHTKIDPYYTHFGCVAIGTRIKRLTYSLFGHQTRRSDKEWTRPTLNPKNSSKKREIGDSRPPLHESLDCSISDF